MDAQTIASEAQTIVSALDHKHMTMLAYRDDAGVHTAIMLPATGSSDVSRQALNIAHIVGATVREEPISDEVFTSPCVGVLRARRRQNLVRSTQAGIDPNAFSKQVHHILGRGQWVAITFRNAGAFFERRRNEKFQRFRLNSNTPTHHSLGGKPAVIQVLAGADDWASARSILSQIAGSMPGFDVDTTERRVSRALPASLTVMSALAVGAAGIGAGIFLSASFMQLLVLLLPAFAALLIALFFALGVLSTRRTRILSALSRGYFPRPPVRLLSPRPPRKAVTDSDGTSTDEFAGDYPVHRDTFLVGSHIPLGIISPQSGALSGSATTAVMNVPPQLTNPTLGPIVGIGRNGENAHLSAGDFYFGVALLGQPSSGKSQLLRSLYGFACADRMQPRGLPGFPGRENALIAFESKDGQQHYIDWARALGDTPELINPMDATGPIIDLFDVPGDLKQRATFVVNALKYGFEEGAIGNQNYAILIDIFTTAQYIDAHPEIVKRVRTSAPELCGDVQPQAGPMVYAAILIGVRGDQRAVALAEAAQAHVSDLRSRGDAVSHDAVNVDDMVTQYFLGRSESSRRSLFQSSINKIQQLEALGSWWNPHVRPALSWETILTGYRNVIVATGATNEGVSIADKLGDQLSAMLLYSLQHAIKRTCVGWQQQGKSVSLYSDELSVLAGSSPDTVTWLRDQGREYGVRPHFATQRPNQLPDMVRVSFLNFATVASFSQTDTATARDVANSLSGAEGEITDATIKHLGRYEIAVRTHINQVRQPVFTCTVGYYENDKAAFPLAQGWDSYSPARPEAVTPAGELDSSKPAREPEPSERPNFRAFDDLYE